MKKTLSALLFLCLLISCSSKTIPVKGAYPKPPITFTSNNSTDIVWDKLIDLFAQKGFVIKIIDRSSGLIISTGKMPVTTEDENGKLNDGDAYIVAAKHKVYGGYAAITGGGPEMVKGKKVVVNDLISGDWNVRVKSNGTGCTININIVNTHTDDARIGNTIYKGHNVDVQTTGYFENVIYELIK